MKKTIITLFIIMASISSITAQTQNKVDETPVDSFDLNRYLGLWYEVARFDNKFERGLSNVTALYKIRPDGKVKVINSGYKDGKLKQAIGKAKIGNSTTQGFLKVSFFMNIYSPYKIVMLADDYSYALVSSGKNYLWILSRKPCLKVEILNKILEEAERRGFDTQKLIYNC